MLKCVFSFKGFSPCLFIKYKLAWSKVTECKGHVSWAIKEMSTLTLTNPFCTWEHTTLDFSPGERILFDIQHWSKNALRVSVRRSSRWRKWFYFIVSLSLVLHHVVTSSECVSGCTLSFTKVNFMQFLVCDFPFALFCILSTLPSFPSPFVRCCALLWLLCVLTLAVLCAGDGNWRSWKWKAFFPSFRSLMGFLTPHKIKRNQKEGRENTGTEIRWGKLKKKELKKKSRMFLRWKPHDGLLLHLK